MTLKDTLLAAARTLPPPFTTAQLAVAAWQADPQGFGLDGYKQHPDHNKVVAMLCKKILKHGLIVRSAPGLYIVGEPNAHARKQRQEARPESVNPIPKRDDHLVTMLVATEAFNFWVGGHTREIDQTKAEFFWKLGGSRKETTAFIDRLDLDDTTNRMLARLNDWLNIKYSRAVAWREVG